MALTFGGLGLALIGQDKSFTKTTKKAVTHIDKLWGGLKHLADTAGKLGAKIGSGLSSMYGKAKGAVGKVGGLVDSLLQKTMSPQLDNSFSSMYAQFNKTFGGIVVGMSISSKEAKKWRKVIGSTAFALNADMSEAAKAWAAFYKQGLKLDALMGTKGMAKSMRALIKMTQVMGVSGEDLANTTAGLVKGFGFTEKGVRSLMDSIFVMGRYFNMGTEAIKGMPGILEVVNNQLADWKKGATAKDVREFMLQIVKTAGGLKEALGMSGESAIEYAKKIFEVLHGNRRNILKLMGGMDGEIGELGKRLWMAAGDPSAFIKILRGNMPMFLNLLRKISKGAKASGADTQAVYIGLKETLIDTLGPNAAYLMEGNWDKATKKFVGLNAVMAQSAGALGKAIKKAFRTGRTAGESYNIMMENYKARLQTLTNKYVPEFMHASKKGFDEAYKTIAALADEKGGIGKVTRALLKVQRFGLSGLFLGMQGVNKNTNFLISQFAQMSQTALPMITALGSMGINLGLIGKLLSPGGLLLMGLALMNDKVRDVVFNGIKTAFDYVGSHWREWVPVISDMLVKLWHGAISVVNWLGDVAVYMINAMGNALRGVDWSSTFDSILTWIGNFASRLINALANFISAVDWGAIVDKLMSVLGNLFKGVWSFISNLITGGESNSKIVNAFLHLARAIGKALIKIQIHIVMSIAKAVVNGLMRLAKKATDITRSIINKGRDALAGLFGWERSAAAETHSAIAESAINMASGMGTAIANAAIDASNIMAQSGTNMMLNSQTVAAKVIEHWANATMDIKGNLNDLDMRAQQTMNGLSVAALSAAKSVAQAAKSALKAMGMDIGKSGDMLGKLIGKLEGMIQHVRKRGVDISFMKPAFGKAKAHLIESKIKEESIAKLARFIEKRSSRRYLTEKGGVVDVMMHRIQALAAGKTITSEKELRGIYNKAIQQTMQMVRSAAIEAIVPQLMRYHGYKQVDSRLRGKLEKEALRLYERGAFRGVSGKFAGERLYQRIESYYGRKRGVGVGGVARLKGLSAKGIAGKGAQGKAAIGTAGMTQEQGKRLVKVKEVLSAEDKEAFADIGYQIKILADAIRDLARRPVVVNIHGKLRQFFEAVQAQSKRNGAGYAAGYAGRG